jgi:hypothetical protein
MAGRRLAALRHRHGSSAGGPASGALLEAVTSAELVGDDGA